VPEPSVGGARDIERKPAKECMYRVGPALASSACLPGASRLVCREQAARSPNEPRIARLLGNTSPSLPSRSWQWTCLELERMRELSTVQRPTDSEGRHDLAVLIPARNEATLIGRCVTSVLDAGVRPQDVYVIDDESTDRTVDALRRFTGINVLRNQQRCGKAVSLLHAIDHYGLVARYAFVSLLDADSHVDSGYFSAVGRAFEDDSKAVLVCGSPRGLAHNYLTAFRTLDYYMALSMYRKGQDRIGVITVAPGCASTYRTSIVPLLDWHGGTLVEDMDLTIQIHRRGHGRVRYAADAIVYTQDPQRIAEYVGQLTRWYSGTWQVMRLHRLPLGRQRIDAEFLVLVGEGLLYSALMLVLPVLALTWPQATLRWMLIDQGVFAVFALICAAHLRRLDVVVWFPTFAILRLIGCGVWLRTFWREIVCGRTLRTWFSVERYNTDVRPSHRARSSLA
jgi:cellulose synthase/poly-beta-1,6-N-acetylglucosamine synthase-like glycosyltransferase